MAGRDNLSENNSISERMKRAAEIVEAKKEAEARKADPEAAADSTDAVMEEQAIEESPGKKKGDKLLRVMAIIFLIGFVALIVALVVCIVTGSKYTLAVLFCLIIFPIILYLMAWLKKVFSS